MPGWENFFVAQVGASAALAGLVFVGISINLAKIVATPGLSGRALEALSALVQVLLVASLMLVPSQSTLAISLELMVIGFCTWLIMILTQIRYWRGAGTQYHRYLPLRIALGQAATLPFIAAGICVQTQGASGFYWVVPGIVFSYLVALLNAWILLVEINR